MKLHTLAVLSLSVLGSACSSFSGLSGSKSDLACQAPDGVICSSVSGIYANSLADALPGQQQVAHQITPGAKTDKDAAPTPVPGYFSPRDLTTPNSGDPIRMPPLVLRVWIAPWEDTDGDLHDQHYFYTVVHQGKWLIETNQQMIRNAFRPVYPFKGKDKSDEEIPEAAAALPSRPRQGGGKP